LTQDGAEGIDTQTPNYIFPCVTKQKNTPEIQGRVYGAQYKQQQNVGVGTHKVPVTEGSQGSTDEVWDAQGEGKSNQ
jgi:hypothetical protein